MSLRVGLGASKADLEVQGEIDFDFFEGSECSGNKDTPGSAEKSDIPFDCDAKQNSSADFKLSEEVNFEKNPLITVSCDDVTGAVQRTNIETVIPTPYEYKESKCGKAANGYGGCKPKKTFSPRLKNKVFKEENELSDDSSISSMSEESESEISSISADSFELEETDSMTDVSPLPSPAPHSPNPANTAKKAKKDSVKFNEENVSPKQQQHCPTCDGLDIQELMNAMQRLKMKQSLCGGNCRNQAMSRNAKCRLNLSFTNAEVRKIEKNNLMLLKKVKAQQNRTKPQENSAPHIRPSSAVNRQKLQRQIELENVAFLRRLESTKASKDLNRARLLRDYDRRASGCFSRSSSRPCTSHSSQRTTTQVSGRSSVASEKSSQSNSVRSLSIDDDSSK